jgi:hypothetical protein
MTAKHMSSRNGKVHMDGIDRPAMVKCNYVYIQLPIRVHASIEQVRTTMAHSTPEILKPASAG